MLEREKQELLNKAWKQYRALLDEGEAVRKAASEAGDAYLRIHAELYPIGCRPKCPCGEEYDLTEAGKMVYARATRVEETKPKKMVGIEGAFDNALKVAKAELTRLWCETCGDKTEQFFHGTQRVCVVCKTRRN